MESAPSNDNPSIPTISDQQRATAPISNHQGDGANVVKKERKPSLHCRKGQHVELYDPATNETIEIFRSLAAAHAKTGGNVKLIKQAMDNGGQMVYGNGVEGQTGCSCF